MDKLTPSAQLVIANQALALQNELMEKRAAELLIANAELLFQNEERERRAAELSAAYKELKRAQDRMKEHVSGLEEMMFITSHKVRKPVANILGLTHMLEDFIRSPSKLRKLVNYLKSAAHELDDFTKELTDFISTMEQKGKG